MQTYINTILIVDDEPVGRATLEALLMNEGYNLIFANNGAEALQKATEFAPDLILTDVMMPDMDGFEVCQRLRSDPILAEVPIIMVTALDDRDSRLQGIEVGADDFITKPFDRVELRTRVRSITRLNRFRRLVTERSKFEWVVEHAEDGYLITRNSEIQYANQKARLYLNLPVEPHHLIDRTFEELVREHYHFERPEAWTKEKWPEQSDCSQSLPQYLVRPETPTSNAFWLQVNLLQINALDKPSEWIIRLRDVTEQMNVQRSRWQFQAMVSHKLRTPMISMLSGMELLAAHADEFSIAEITHLAQRAVEGTRRLRSEIDDILQHTRISVIPRPGLKQEFMLVQLQSLVAEICQDLKLDHVTVSMDQNLVGNNTILTISQPAIKLVLREILENAQKFHPTGTPHINLDILPSNSNASVLIKITDDGLTLSPEQLAQVWTPYYQGEKYFTGEVVGMGLGLSMVASIIWSAGGSCRMYNREPGSGVIVELILPL